MRLILCTVAAGVLAAQSPVGMVVREYKDPARPNWRTEGPRPETTVVWYPAPAGTPTITDWDKSPFGGNFVPVPVAPDAPLQPAPGGHPVVLLSHGATAAPWSLTWLGTFLASHGYIAAGMVHHGDSGYEGAPLPQGFILRSERVKDMSVVLDLLLKDAKFGPHIDPKRVVAAGHSSGGATVIALAGGIFDGANMTKYCEERPKADFCMLTEQVRTNIAKFDELRKADPALQKLYEQQNRSYRDPRVRAVLALAPAIGPGFNAAGLRPVKIPVWIVSGDADNITPLDENAKHYADLIRGAKLTVIPHAGHMLFGGECTPAGLQKMAVLCVDDAAVDRHKVLQKLSGDALVFFNTSLGMR